MIECPNCGMENPVSRAFCSVCGERLPQEALNPPAPAVAPEEPPDLTGDSSEASSAPDIDWLLAEDTEAGESVQSESGLPDLGGAQEPPQPEPERASAANLPSWLLGAELVTEPPAREETDWDESLDFSDLPDWPLDVAAPSEDELTSMPSWVHTEPEDDPIQSPELTGSGLLEGVRGPIPIEPVIALSHRAPAFPGLPDSDDDSQGANLFARIAGGAVVPEPVVLPASPPRGVSLFHLVLILAISIPLALNLSIFGRSPLSPSVAAFQTSLDRIAGGSPVLLAFEYEGGMAEELNPAVRATLNYVRSLPGSDGEVAAPVRFITVSTTPQGPALAELNWANSVGPEADWHNLGYLSGGSVGIRTLLDQRLGTLQLAGTSLEELSLIIVVGNETADIRRWIEQVGTLVPGTPLVAIAPALAEPTLSPYLASGQLDGFIAGTAGVASFEAHGAQETRGVGTRRIDGLTLGALLLLGVIAAGNLTVLGRRRTTQQGL